MKNELVLFESHDGMVKLDVNIEGETVWINRSQIGYLHPPQINLPTNAGMLLPTVK